MCKTYHCLFEQSGTFKNEFIKLGFNAIDYDILDDYGETDYKLDLFEQIQVAYNGGGSIFDNMKCNDEIIAFFPCTRFEDQIQLSFRGDAQQLKNWSDVQKLEYDLKLHDELHHMYEIITKLAIVCIKKNIPLIIENPYSTTHHLRKYWCLKPSVIDKDRSERGDYFKKPTQYWFINRKPSNNLIFDAVAVHKRKRVTAKVVDGGTNEAKERSLISKDYANRFIKEFII